MTTSAHRARSECSGGARAPTTTLDPQGRVITQVWFSCGALDALADANGNRTSWACPPKQERRRKRDWQNRLRESSRVQESRRTGFQREVYYPRVR